MNFTLSDHAAAAILERDIDPAWVARTLTQADRLEADRADATLKHALARIPERDGRVLRVIFNFTKEPPHVVTAYFDRAMKGQL
jgi:hypothetical protein